MIGVVLGLKASWIHNHQWIRKGIYLHGSRIPDSISLNKDLNREEITSGCSQSETLGEHLLFGFVRGKLTERVAIEQHDRHNR